MDDVFDTPETPDVPQGETQADQTQQQPGEGGQGAAPPAADTTSHVPLAALEAERKGRQDWKERATRAEERARMLEEQQAAAARQQPPLERDPAELAQARLETVILNASERAARKEYGGEVVDKAFERMSVEFAKNPALYHQVMASADPWDELVQQGKRLTAMDEIGSDPLAYRQKVEAEIRASFNQSEQPPAQRIPSSLADTRSAGARGTTFTGPTPLDSLFPN